ncbi:MAG: TIM barrel protein, partial [Oscillospiraceae bacterium]|nr:TIM barrel protein [Oscillospiraceae bacterium]MDD4369359.1 TIM barrel protein [Oscillospiraceae bacterium]
MTSSVPEPTVQTPKSLIAICQWCLPNPEISGLTQARTLGFDGVQLDLGIQTDTRNLTEPAKLSACLAAVKDSGLSVPTLGLNYVALNRSDQETTICRILDQSLAIAAKLGAKTLQLCSFWEGGMHSAEAFAHTVRHLRYICHQAEAYDLVIGSENDLDLTGNQKLLDAVSYPNFGIYFDTANPWLYTRADALLMLQTLYP